MLGSTGRRIALALALTAVVVVVLSGSSDSASSADQYTTAANRLCRTARGKIAGAVRRHRSSSLHGNFAPLARSLFTVIGHLHVRLGNLKAPGDSVVQAVELVNAQFETEKSLVATIQLSPAEKQRVQTNAEQLEDMASRAEHIASLLGLTECARLHLRFSPPP